MATSNADALLAALANLSLSANDSLASTPMPLPLLPADGSAAVTPETAVNSTQSPASAQAFIDDFLHKMHLLQIFVVIGYGLMSVLCVALACYLRYNRNVALKGDASAARKILLPAFEPLIWILALATGAFALVVALTLALDTFRDTVTSVASEAFYCGRMFVMLMVIVYMLQKSVTLPALVRTVGLSLAGCSYTLVVEIVLTNVDDGSTSFAYTRHVTMLFAKGLLLGFFTYVFARPPGRATRRTLREYIAFIYVYYALVYAYTFLLHAKRYNEGFVMVYVTSMWAALTPLFIWRVLSADTQHWRGMGQRAVALQSLFRQKHNLDERVSSQGLHVLIEMHRKFIIDFAYLELKHKIGMGSSAVVFNGVLHSKTPVAVKVYTPQEFDEDTVAEFSHEAALCGALHHPNVVKFYGMCVCPPTICLVSELCQGSLDDVTTAVARARQHPNRQQQLLDVGYMLDAARAVAYIHSFSPAFVHRDIKPSNFLVDIENTVKLTDFGESRSLPKSHAMALPLSASAVSVGGSGSFLGKSVALSSGASLRRQRGRQSSGASDVVPQAAQLTVKGTVDYMAPEIIQGRAGVAQYGEAADVYSLAITMWDILNPGKEKFPMVGSNHLHIFESVVEGKRPQLDDAAVHATLRAVVESAWHSDPRLRPSAQNIVSILESVQEELFAVFAADLCDEMGHDAAAVGRSRYGELGAVSFPVAHAVARMEELCFVNSASEALRLGNALMDAGLLHHARHERPFEHGDGLYFFDDDNINLCRPLLAPGEGRDAHHDAHNVDVDDDEQIDHLVPLPGNTAILGGARASSGRPARRSKPRPQQPRRKISSTTSHTAGRAAAARSEMATMIFDNGLCPCRKLGQRLEQPKSGAGAKMRFRRHRTKAASEENILTAKLLGAEHQLPHHVVPLVGEFDEFESVNTNFQQHRDADGGLA